MRTIQEANVIRLREIDPARVFIDEASVTSFMNCQTDFLHGKAVCWLLADGQQDADVLCVACAVRVTELWLQNSECQVTIAVTR